VLRRLLNCVVLCDAKAAKAAQSKAESAFKHWLSGKSKSIEQHKSVATSTNSLIHSTHRSINQTSYPLILSSHFPPSFFCRCIDCAERKRRVRRRQRKRPNGSRSSRTRKRSAVGCSSSRHSASAAPHNRSRRKAKRRKSASARSKRVRRECRRGNSRRRRVRVNTNERTRKRRKKKRLKPNSM
jgi:hypothetical protein